MSKPIPVGHSPSTAAAAAAPVRDFGKDQKTAPMMGDEIRNFRQYCQAVASAFARTDVTKAKDGYDAGCRMFREFTNTIALLSESLTIGKEPEEFTADPEYLGLSVAETEFSRIHKAFTTALVQAHPYASIDYGAPCIAARKQWDPSTLRKHEVLRKLSIMYPEIRPIRGDGNCFYAAYTALFLTYVVANTPMNTALVTAVNASGVPFQDPVKCLQNTSIAQLIVAYTGSAAHQFSQTISDDTQLTPAHKKAMTDTLALVAHNDKRETLLDEMILDNNRMMLPFIHYFRQLAARYIETNRPEFADVVDGSITKYCDEQVSRMGVEADQPAMQALTKATDFPLEVVNVVLKTNACSSVMIGRPGRDAMGVLCRQGEHYYVLYKTRRLVPPPAATAAAAFVPPAAHLPYAGKVVHILHGMREKVLHGDVDGAMMDFTALDTAEYREVMGKVYGHMYWHHVQCGKKLIDDVDYGRNAFNPDYRDHRNFNVTFTERAEVLRRTTIDVILDGVHATATAGDKPLIATHLELLKQHSFDYEGRLYGCLFKVLKEESGLPKEQWDFMNSGRLLFRDEALHKIDSKWKVRAIEILRKELKTEWGIK